MADTRKIIDWDEQKNKELLHDRGVCFEDVLMAMEEQKVIDIIPHHNQQKYPHQYIYVVEPGEYTYYVPFVESDHVIFLKTIIPSRKLYKKYL